jgi:hypothetical protein
MVFCPDNCDKNYYDKSLPKYVPQAIAVDVHALELVTSLDDTRNSQPGMRTALRSNVNVRAQPALIPSALMRASANDPSPDLSATMPAHRRTLGERFRSRLPVVRPQRLGPELGR